MIKVISQFVGRYSGHHGFRRYLKNTGWMFLGQAVSMASSFVVVIFLARYLGPDNYGLLNYVMSFCIIFAFLAGFGIDSVLNRELVKNPQRYNEYLGTGFIIKFLGAFLCIGVIALSAYIMRLDFFSKTLIFIYSLSFIFQSFYVISVFFQSRVEAKYNRIAEIIYNVISLIIKLLLIYFGLGVFWLVLAYAFDTAILSFCYLVIYKKNKLKVNNWRFNSGLAKTLLRDSWPLMFSSLAITIYMKIDAVMIRSMLNDNAVGIYAAAAKLSEAWYFIPGIICGSVFPAIVNAHRTDSIQFTKRLKKVYSLMFWLSFLIALVITFSSEFIIRLMYGSAYASAAPILSVHVWSGVGVFLGVAVTQYLIVENYNRIFFYSTSASAILNVVLNFILIPRIGIMGAAIATLISYFSATLFILFFKKSRKQALNIFEGIIFKF
ncbi:MAG: flippase [Patescibacteria group bacterium]|jgi:O-antigen/teichoic acid export membrane protein